MATIHLETFINAPVELCFDLARNIDAHVAAATESGERAVAGVTSGMISLGEEVTWEAVHFGVRQRLTSRIVAFDRPRTFTDEMQRGAFKRWRHTHIFETRGAATLMIDDVDYASPLGALGRLVDALYLKDYMTRLLLAHNDYIRRLAEATTREVAAVVATTTTTTPKL